MNNQHNEHVSDTSIYGKKHSTPGINTVFRTTRFTMTSDVPHDSALVEAATATELSR
uniref:Uncharacterized protein n=1 Tax=Caenorhabditis japonica TaxID=281687 RepID=A0A8R1IBB6_CAEJA